MTHRDKSGQDHASPSAEPNAPKDPKEVTSMHEQDQPSKEEMELERIFAEDLGVEALPSPPPGLADRIKAEIPDDLGSARPTGKTGVVVPFWRRGRGVLALAATAILAAALWLVTPRHETAMDGLVSDSKVSAPAPAVPAEAAQTPTDAEALQIIPAPDDGDEGVEVPSARAQGTRQAQMQPQSQDDRKELQEQMRGLESQVEEMRAEVPKPPAAMAKKIPSPDPTPREPEPLLDGRARRSPPPPSAPTSAAAEYRRLEESEASGLVQLGYAQSPPAPPPPEAPLSVAETSYGIPESEPYQVPNDQAHADMFFDSAGVNPFVDTEDDALSTFGLDVDTASYTVVRGYLQEGNLPPKDAVRVEEMLNFFDYGDAAPSRGDAGAADDFALHADVAPSRWAPDANRSERYYLVRFGLRARDVIASQRPPALLTFVVDVSGSMSGGNRLGLVQQSLGLLLDRLRPDDRVALVVYGSQGRVLLEPTSDHEAVQAAIRRLVPEGSTNAAEGLRLGYELTARNRRPGNIHRIILCSDGVANTGSTTSGEGILAEVERWGKQGVELTTVGFGMGNYNDTLMETLADKGNGRYAYVDTLDEARRLFVDDLTGTLTTVAAEARVQVSFDPEVVARYRLLGYENRDIADERFRDDTVDAGEIGAGRAVTALYEVKTNRPLRPRDHIATLTLRYASIARGQIVEQSLPLSGRDAASSFAEAPRALRLAATVAEFAEVLRGSYWARDVDLGEIFAEAQRVSAEWPGDADVAEFASLVGKADRLRRAAR